jgi:hypothetical protein
MTSDKEIKTHDDAIDAFEQSIQELEDFKLNPEEEADIDNIPYLDESAKKLEKLSRRASKEEKPSPRSSSEAIEMYDADDADDENDASFAPVEIDEEDELNYEKFNKKVNSFERDKQDAYLQDIEAKYQEAYNKLNYQDNELISLKKEREDRLEKDLSEREYDLKYALKLARRDDDEDAMSRIEDALMEVKVQKHTRVLIKAQESMSPPAYQQPRQYVPPFQQVQQSQYNPYYQPQQYHKPEQPQYNPYQPYGPYQPQQAPSQRERPKVAAPRSQAPIRREKEAPRMDRRALGILDNMPLKNADGSSMSEKQKAALFNKAGE